MKAKKTYYKIGIAIPTYNESKNIPILVKKIIGLRLDAKIIIVDDNSPDGTGEIADNFAKKYKNKVFVIHRKGKLGLGTAEITGFKKAMAMKCDLIFSMDGDLSHNPKYIPDFLEKIGEGYDIVLGSRYVKGGDFNKNIKRKIISRGANLFAKLMLGMKVNDLTTGYRCYKRKVLESIELDKIKSDGYSFLEEILFFCKKKGFKMAETPIIFTLRKEGKSKLAKKEIIKFFFTILRLKFTK